MPKIAFYTLGCRSNQYETDKMVEQARSLGYDVIPYPQSADIYVINTCTVTRNADKKSRHAIRFAKKINPNAKVIATGCYVETDIFDLKEVDVVLNNKDKTNIFKCLPKIKSQASRLKSPRIRANLMIENGCENFCSYCIVPFVRGKVTSKPLDQAISEAKQMVKDGVKEIILTGINLGEFDSLPTLIDKLSKIDDLLRIRLSSIEPMYITDELIKAVKDDPKVCRHLHIPMQSGDDRILKAMNRSYTSKDFSGMAKKIKEQIKDIAITTDIIVGFPGEDEKAFKNTLKLVDMIQFSRIHIFSYSDRPGTAAFNFKNKLDPKTITRRYEKLEQLRDKYMLRFHRSFKKKPMEVLIEQKDRKTGLYEGLTSNYIRVFIRGNESIGQLVDVKFESFQGENVIATPVLV